MHSGTRRHLVAALLLVAGAAGANLLWARRAPQVRYDVNFREVPMQIAEMTGRKVPVDQQTFSYLGADVMEEREYAGEGRAARLSLVYGRDWRAVHSPLSCLPQQGWQVAEKRLVDVAAPPGIPHSGPLHGQLLLARRSNQQLMVLYVFAHRGGTVGDWVKQGWIVSQAPAGTGGLMLSLSTYVVAGETGAAQRLLEEVLTSVYAPAVSFWYS